MSIEELEAMIWFVNRQAMHTRRWQGECKSWFAWNSTLRRLWDQHAALLAERMSA